MHTNFLVGERIGYFLGPCGSRLVRILYTRFLESIQQCWYILLCTCVRLYIVYYTRLSDVVGPVCVRNRPGVFGEDSAARGLIYFMYASVHTHTHTHTYVYMYMYTLSTLHWWRIHARYVGYIVYHVSCPRASSPVWCGGNGAGGGEVGLYE